MSKKIKNEQKKFLGETLNQYDKALDEAINQLDKKNREQNHKISSLVNSFDNEYLEKDVEGNITTLENSKDGMVIINEIQGSTEVNYCKDGEKELILNGDIDTQGESFVTITEGVDGGLVDVSLEGNTEINLSKTKDPVLVTREFDDINCNTGKLQYTIDDVTTINDEPGKVDIDRIVGDTMVNHAVNGSEELILNAHINESGDNNIILNGVTSDGGKVDVYLEGNTLVNVSKTKDDYITPTIEDKVDQGSVISLPEVSEGLIHIDEIEGNTMVNYCTDGAKELTLNGDIDVEGVSVTTTEGVDNGLVDVALEGNTLVNLAKYHNSIDTTTLTDYYNSFKISDTSLFKEGVEYTLIYTLEIDNSSNSSYTYMNLGLGTDNIMLENMLNFGVPVVSNGMNLIKFTFTNPNNRDALVIRPLRRNTAPVEGESATYSYESLMLLEGDWTDKEIPEYFEGMKSVGQDDENGHKIEIVSRNKNEINMPPFTQSFTNSQFAINDVVNLPINGKTFSYRYDYEIISISTEQDSFITNLAGTSTYNPTNVVQDFDLTIVNQRLYNGAKGTVVVNNISNSVQHTLRDIRCIRTSTPVTMTFKITNFALYFSDNADTYIPYAENKKEILLNEPLRSLPNGVKDRFVKIGGKWFIERKCVEKILDGSEDEKWETGYNSDDEVNHFKTFTVARDSIQSTNIPLKCDKVNVTTHQVLDVGSGYGINLSYYLRINLVNCDAKNGATVDDLKQWLQQNPIKVVYELAIPIYEPLEIEPTLNTYNDTTHISNNSIIPCNMHIKNTGYNAIIKPSTLYTIAVDTNKSGTIGINLGGAEVTTTNNVATITTPETLTDDSLRLYGKGIKASKVRLLEGDKTNWIPSHFEGMKSSFEDKVQEDGSYKMEIVSNNKNLLSIGESLTFDVKTIMFDLKKGKYIIDYESVSGYQNGAVVVIAFNKGENKCITAQYVSKGKIIELTEDCDRFTLYSNDFNWVNSEGKFVTINTLQLSRGEAIVGEPVPHKSNKIQFSSIEPLRGVGDVKDRLVFKDGKLMIERNYGSVTLNGGENENYIVWVNPNKKPTQNVFILDYSRDIFKNIAIKSDGHNAVSYIIDNFSKGDVSSTGFVCQFYNNMHLGLPKACLENEDNSDIKQWLQQHPTTVVYQLAEPTYEEIPYDLQKIILESYDNGTLFFDTNIPPTKVSFNCFEEELTYLYPATSYTVQFMSDRDTIVDITLGGTELLAQNIVKGLNRISITTPSALVDNKLIIEGAGAKISDVVVTNTDREFRYFEGMKSVGECEGNVIEILSQNKNLIDNSKGYQSSYASWIPNIGSLNNVIETDVYNATLDNRGVGFLVKDLKPNTQYTLSIPSLLTDNKLGYGLYDNENSINNWYLCIQRQGNISTNKITFTTPNKKTVAVVGVYGDYDVLFNNGALDGTITVGNYRSLQLEEGSVVTDYIPHQSNAQQLAHEPLRAVGEVKDRYVLIDGKWYIERNCIKFILDGSNDESWGAIGYGGHETRNTFEFRIDNNPMHTKGGTLKSICDMFITEETLSIPTKDNAYRIVNSISSDSIKQYFLFTPSTSIIPYRDLNAWKEWLSVNPITIIVECSPTYELINYNPLETYSEVTHISTNSAIPCNVTVKNHGYNLVALKESTQYTLYVNKNTTNALTYRLGDYVEINSSSKFTFTTPETLTDKTLRIDGKGIKVKDLMLIEGTPTNDSVGYFDGLKSSYECEQVTDESDENYGKYKVDVKVVGKNLFDGELEQGSGNGSLFVGIHYTQYQNNSNTRCRSKNLIEVIPNTQYTASYSDKGFQIAYWEIDKNGIVTKDSGWMGYNIGKITFNTMPTTRYLKFVFEKNGLTITPSDILMDIQLEEGSTATDYEPYFESKQTVYLNSPLLKGDEIVWKDNKIQHYHKMGIVVLDGSDDEGWGAVEDKGRFIKFGRDALNFKFYPGDSHKLYCDILPTNTEIVETEIERLTLFCHNENYRELRCNLLKSRLSELNVEGLKQWLQQNPVKVVYELNTPYYEEISDYPLKLNIIANSSLSTESTIQVTNISFNIYEETLPYLYPNTKYYITFNADVDRNNIIIDLGGSHVVLDCKVGFNKVEITTPNDTTNLLTFSGTGVNIDHVKVTQQDIDEYFEGMKSVGECEGNVINILSNNKNLLKINNDTNYENCGKQDDGSIVSNFATNRPYAWLRFKFDTQKLPKGEYYVTFKLKSLNGVYSSINGARINKDNTIMNDSYVNIAKPVTTSDYQNYCTKIILNSDKEFNQIFIQVGNVPNMKVQVKDIMITKTEDYNYIVNSFNKQQLTHEPLRSVGDVRDKYVMVDGKWYIERNCKEFILTDSLDYSLGNTSSTPFIQFTFELDSSSDYTTTDKIICNRINTTNVYTNNTNIGICYVKNDTIRIRLTNSDTLDSFKAWLNQDLTVIIYKLQTPIYEPLDYNPFETYADITHISTNSLIPTNVVVKNHGYNCILKPSTKYTVALNKPNGTISAKLGGSAKVDSTNSIFTITTPSTLNDNVLRLSGSGNVKDIMILEGDKTVNTPSYFEGIESVFEQEYDTEKGKYRVTARVEGNGKESSIIFYLNEPLRGTGSAKDKVFIQDSKVVVERNCSSITLDGSKNIHKANTDFDSVNNISFSIDIDNIAPSWANCNNIVCSTLPNVGNRTWKGNMEGITSNDIIILLCISRNKLQTQDVNGFKQWLQANPTKIVYVLAEPVYEEADCDLSKLVLENYENSSLIFESNIPVSANIKYSGEVPVVTQAKSLSSQIDNTTLDINENIIPYMCDIDYRIVELQLMNGDTQGEGIELLGIGDIEILGNENVLFNNREDKKHNFSYDMLKRDILSQRYSKEEYRYRLDRYLLANKISNEEYKELEGLLNNGK